METILEEGMSRKEASRFLEWYNTEHAALYPPPALVIKGFDWKFRWSIITSIATVILASLRTAQMFYNSAELSARTWGVDASGIWIVSLFDATMAMLAVEGGLVVISAIRTSDKDKVSDDIYKWQIFILIVISVMAGLGQSIGLIQGLPEEFLKAFSYGLSFVLGVGASFAAWFSGEVLGMLLNKHASASKKAEEDFQKDMESYQKNARKSWKEKKEQEKEERRLRKLSEGVSNEDGNLPENSSKISIKFPDWANLSEDEYRKIANWTPSDLENEARKHGKTPRTMSNYRKMARAELGMTDTESEENVNGQ